MDVSTGGPAARAGGVRGLDRGVRRARGCGVAGVCSAGETASPPEETAKVSASEAVSGRVRSGRCAELSIAGTGRSRSEQAESVSIPANTRMEWLFIIPPGSSGMLRAVFHFGGRSSVWWLTMLGVNGSDRHSPCSLAPAESF